MPIEIQTQRALFDPFKGSDLGNRKTLTFVFSPEVRRATAMISGFDFEFVSADHAFHQAKIETAVSEPTGNFGELVAVDVVLLLRDFSGHTDDPFEGWVDVTVIAER